MVRWRRGRPSFFLRRATASKTVKKWLCRFGLESLNQLVERKLHSKVKKQASLSEAYLLSDHQVQLKEGKKDDDYCGDNGYYDG